MKIAVIGGAGVRTPLLVRGLTGSDLPIESISLFDTDTARLRLIAPLAERLARRAAVTVAGSAAEAVDGADFVFTSIRVGGAEARAHDEAASIARGFIGQETVGPAGFAMALRSIPSLVSYAEDVRRLAPGAWVINFTNPVGIVSEAVRRATGVKILGICDTPTELFEDVARALGFTAAEAHFDYFGLNHLGWLREVWYHGAPQLGQLWPDTDALSRIYRAPLFEREFLCDLRLLPTEYLYYYYRPDVALANLRRAGQSRGVVVEALNRRLIADLAASPADPIAVYDRYLADRNGSYMQIESGGALPAPSAEAELTGYDRIALAVVRAIHFNTGRVIPLNVRNGGTIPDLEDDDTVEVPCVVNGSGAWPLHVGPVPPQVRDLLRAVKAYERLTADAALSGSRDAALRALAGHPFVIDPTRAADLMPALAL